MPRRKKGRKKNRISKNLEEKKEINTKIEEENNIKNEVEIKDSRNDEPKIDLMENNIIKTGEEMLKEEQEKENIKIKIDYKEKDYNNQVKDNNKKDFINKNKLIEQKNEIQNETKNNNDEFKEEKLEENNKDKNEEIKEAQRDKIKVIKDERIDNIEIKNDNTERKNEDKIIEMEDNNKIKTEKIEKNNKDKTDEIRNKIEIKEEEENEEVKDKIQIKDKEDEKDETKKNIIEIKDRIEEKNEEKKDDLKYIIEKKEERKYDIIDNIEIKEDSIEDIKNEENVEIKVKIKIDEEMEEQKENKENEIKEEKVNSKNKEDKKILKNNDKIIEENEKKKIEEKNNLLKITNMEYEKFIKENSKLYQFIKKVNIPIIIHNFIFNKKEEINIKNYSLLKIIKQSNLENEFKIFMTIQIITETVEFEISSCKKITFNPTVEKFIKNINNLNISFSKNRNEINDILVPKRVFIKIFSQMDIDYSKNIFNYLEFIITEISYEFRRTKKVYVLKGVKSLKKLIEQNKIFYINKNNKKRRNSKNKYSDNIIPLSNYTTQKIFNLFNEGKDTKFLLLNYKIKSEQFKNYENDNQKYLDKLINASDVKNMIIKYEIESKRDSLKLFKQKKLNNFPKVGILDLEIFLNITEKNLFNIKNQIKSKKKEITNLSEDQKNQFIEYIDSEKNKKYINNQYIKLMKGENNKFNKNIYSFDCYDYNNEKITVLKKYLDDALKEENIYVEVKINENNYLVNKNKLLKIFDGWKILEQEDIIDGINSKNIKNKLKEYNNEKVEFKLKKVNIILQDAIKEIKLNENDENKINKNNINDNNIIIIEEEENNLGEDDKILRNVKNETNEDIDSKRLKIIEYFNSLPQKKSYNIKFKVKTQKIPKKK